jgi:hypothetical protein
MSAIRQSLCSVLREPGFTATIILTCALGIGASAAVYSLVYAILLRPFPFRDPDHLVRVQTRHIQQEDALQRCSLLDVGFQLVPTPPVRLRASPVAVFAIHTSQPSPTSSDAPEGRK